MDSAPVRMFIGIILVTTAVLSAPELITGFEQFLGIDIQAHHGVLVVGLYELTKALADLFGGIEHLRK